MYVYIDIYIERDRELEERWEKKYKKQWESIDLYTYIYVCPVFWLLDS